MVGLKIGKTRHLWSGIGFGRLVIGDIKIISLFLVAVLSNLGVGSLCSNEPAGPECYICDASMLFSLAPATRGDGTVMASSIPYKMSPDNSVWPCLPAYSSNICLTSNFAEECRHPKVKERWSRQR